jgi:hypothetical protein
MGRKNFEEGIMKKSIFWIIAVLVILPGIYADEVNPTTDGQLDARLDAENYKAQGWGLLAFGASALFSPLLGGGIVIGVAYLAQGGADIPPIIRIAEAEEKYDDNIDVAMYQMQYKKTYINLRNKQRARRAWIGTGIGFGVNLLIITYLLYTS